MTPARRWGSGIAALGALAIAALTLHPTPDAEAAAAATPLHCLVCGERGGVDVILNVLLFTPLGFGLRLAGLSCRRTAIAAACVSLLIELLQLTVIVGRDASLSDLITNTTGGGLGAAVAAHWGGLVRPAPRRAWRLLLATSAVWIGLLGMSGWLQAPAWDGGVLTGVWGGGTAPDSFTGKVLAMRIGGIALPVTAPLGDSGALGRGLREDRIDLEAEVSTGPVAPGRRPIFVLREGASPRLLLSQHGRSAVFAIAARSTRYGLNPPTVVLPEAFPASPGLHVTVRAVARDRTVRLESSYPGASPLTVALGPARGWSLLTPYGIGLGPRVRLVTGLLIAALVLPLGFWAGASGAPGRALGTVAAALVAGLGVLPALQGFRPSDWSEWVAAVSAAAVGWALHHAGAYLQGRCGSPSTSESF